MLEEQRDFRTAQEQWLKALPLLPEDSSQAVWIQEHVRDLNITAPEQPPRQSKWWRLAPVAPIVLAIFNLKFILSFAAFLGIYWSAFGMVFALGFAIQILIHEMGHYIDIKRRGLPADLPVFLPGLGAYVRWAALGVSLETRAAVSLAGPLAGWVAAAVCGLVWFKTGDGIWGALARSGAWLNLLNLIPVWGIDGGHAFLAMTRKQRGVLFALSLLLYAVIREPVLIFIAIGAAWRLFTSDSPEESGLTTACYFAAVLCGLVALLWLLPGQGFGAP
jgi:Zn-dependent protease